MLNHIGNLLIYVNLESNSAITFKSLMGVGHIHFILHNIHALHVGIEKLNKDDNCGKFREIIWQKKYLKIYTSVF